MSIRLFRLLHGSRMKDFDGLPGPTPTFPFGTGLDFMGKLPWEVCARYGREYGGVTRIWLGGRPALVLNDPHLIGEVLDTRADDFYKDSPRAALLPVITDNGPFLANGADWKRKRENHPFQMDGLREWLAAQVAPMREVLREGARRLTALPGPVDVGDTVRHLGFDAFAAAVWGRTFETDVYRWFQTMARTGDRRLKLDVMAPPGPPFSPWFYDARRRWVALFSSVIDEAKAPDRAPGVDLLSVLLGRGKPATDGFRDAMANIFFGGVFSAFSAVSTSLYLLAHHPAARCTVCERNWPAAAATTAWRRWRAASTSIASCGRRCAIIRPRRSTSATRRRTVPSPSPAARSLLTPSCLSPTGSCTATPRTGRTRIVSTPAGGRTAGRSRDPMGSGWFFPFGRGPRTCLGQPFALFAMKLTLAVLVAETRLELDLSLPYRQDFFFGVMTPGGLKGRFLPPGG